VAKKVKSCSHCDVTHRQRQTQNKKIFQSLLKDLPNPQRVWTAL